MTANKVFNIVNGEEQFTEEEFAGAVEELRRGKSPNFDKIDEKLLKKIRLLKITLTDKSEMNDFLERYDFGWLIPHKPESVEISFDTKDQMYNTMRYTVLIFRNGKKKQGSCCGRGFDSNKYTWESFAMVLINDILETYKHVNVEVMSKSKLVVCKSYNEFRLKTP